MLDRLRVRRDFARQLLDRVERRVIQRLQPRRGRIDTLERGQLTLQLAEVPHHALVAVLERPGNAARDGLQLFGVREPGRFVVQRGLLAFAQPRGFDFVGHVAEVVRTAGRIVPTTDQAGHGAARLLKRRVRRLDRTGRLDGTSKPIEHAALRLLVEKNPRVVLPVHRDEQPPDLGEDRRRHRRSVDPGPCAARRGHLALEHQHAIAGVEPVRIQRAHDVRRVADRELSLDDGLVGAGAHVVDRRALADEQPQRANDDRLPRPGLTAEHVEPRVERQRHGLDDREVLDPELGQHAGRRSVATRRGRRARPTGASGGAARRTTSPGTGRSARGVPRGGG